VQLEVNQDLVESGMVTLLEATPLRVAAGPYEVVVERRKNPEDCAPRQQSWKALEEGHLEEEEEEEEEGRPILAVDIGPCPTLPPEALVDGPIGLLERNLATTSPRFAMLLHFARNCHILRNHPREWALFGE
jgi:hypothetical protein